MQEAEESRCAMIEQEDSECAMAEEGEVAATKEEEEEEEAEAEAVAVVSEEEEAAEWKAKEKAVDQQPPFDGRNPKVPVPVCTARVVASSCHCGRNKEPRDRGPQVESSCVVVVIGLACNFCPSFVRYVLQLLSGEGKHGDLRARKLVWKHKKQPKPILDKID
ncbi:hypothetical protein B0H19DRAFT_1077701 [Mycena capillaripes]|nr:hypothetical protein B0H19DRAFT_1077701 [Mycena capillaripes]